MKKRHTVIAGFLAFVIGFTMTPLASVPLFAAEEAPKAITMGTEVLKKNAGLAGAQTVRFMGRAAGEQENNQWDVIAYDGKDGTGKTLTYQNAAGQDEALYEEGRITLFYKGENWSFNYDAKVPYDITYSTSTLNQVFLSEAVFGAYSPLEWAAIVPRELKGQTGNRYHNPDFDANRIFGNAVSNAKMWPLSEAEANKLPDAIRSGNLHYWLRTPGNDNTEIAYIFVTGAGQESWVDFGYTQANGAIVRQALYLNKDAVCFTSATKEGKISGETGPDALIEVNTATDNDWTLTLYDDGRTQGLDSHKDFKVTESTYDEKTESVTLKYSGVPVPDPEKDAATLTKSEEYVSAILQDADGNIKYYGRIAKVETGDSPNGEVTVHLAGKRADGDRLFVFSERIPAAPNISESLLLTMRTELASKLFEVATSVPEEPEKTADPSKEKESIGGLLIPQLKAKGKNSMILTWNKVQGAAGYDVFFGACDGKGGKHTKSLKNVKTVKAGKKLKYTKKGLKKQKAYSAYVKAFVWENGKKKYISTSEKVHTFTSGGNAKCSNPKSISVKKTKISLKKKKTYQIRAEVILQNPKKKGIPKKHAPALRYASSNSKIAAVSRTGKITAKGKGSCSVYVYAANGVRKVLSVKVK